MNRGQNRVLYVRAGLQKESQSILITNDTFELPEVSKAAVVRQPQRIQVQPQRAQQMGRQQMVMQTSGRTQGSRQQMSLPPPQKQAQYQRASPGQRKYAIFRTLFSRLSRMLPSMKDYLKLKRSPIISVNTSEREQHNPSCSSAHLKKLWPQESEGHMRTRRRKRKNRANRLLLKNHS